MTDTEQKKIFAQNLNRYLSISNKSQKEVADAIGVSPQTFNTWCQAIALPRMGKVQKLADYFKIEKSDLIDEKKHSTEYDHYTNLASIYFSAIMHWSAEKGMSEEQTTAIRDHFAELLLRYKTLLEHYFQTNLNWKRERDAYIEFYSHGANKKSAVEIEELYLKEALKEQLKNLGTWTNTFPLKISMCKSESIEILNAAHARTGIDIPEGTDTSDNDIMDDDDF